MTTNSPNPVDGDVQALIEKEMDAFEKWFLSYRTDWDKGSLYRINYKKGPGYSSSYVQAMWKGWSAHKELTQTAQLLRPVELPEAKDIHDGKSEKARQRCEGWNGCLAEVQRLNATAQAKCQKCGDTGIADSGGTQPWGEQILIECDCATAQPVSDGWVKCSERMPPIGKRVLIPTSGLGEAIEAVRFESNKFNRFGIEVVADYWMPLPAAQGGQDD